MCPRNTAICNHRNTLNREPCFVVFTCARKPRLFSPRRLRRSRLPEAGKPNRRDRLPANRLRDRLNPSLLQILSQSPLCGSAPARPRHTRLSRYRAAAYPLFAGTQYPLPHRVLGGVVDIHQQIQRASNATAPQRKRQATEFVRTQACLHPATVQACRAGRRASAMPPESARADYPRPEQLWPSSFQRLA